MRRVLLLALASCGLLAIGPAASQARTHHHKRHHHARHHLRQIRTFGDVPTSGSSNTGNPTSSTSPDAGTVDSFTNGVLTIKLADGSTVSGTVTQDTEIECQNGDEMGNDVRMDGGPGPSGSGDQGDDNDQGDQGDDNDLADQGDDNGNAQNCDPATVLTSGAAVHDAELILTSSGASWKRVDLG